MENFWIYSNMSIREFEWKGGATIDPNTNSPYEEIIGDPNFKQIWWLKMAIEAADKVARIAKPLSSATGFLISNDLLLTNHHVFRDEESAAKSIIQFNYQVDMYQTPHSLDIWECDPSTFFITDKDLDYTVVKLKPNKEGVKAGEKWGYFDISQTPEININERVNIIQHPKGRYKEIAFRDNQVRALDCDFIQYLTDTDYGSSGSPVLNDEFIPIALHSQRVADPNSPGTWYRNQGFLISRIYKEIKAYMELNDKEDGDSDTK